MIDHGKEIRKSGKFSVIIKKVACFGRREMSNNGKNERIIGPQVVRFCLVSQRKERNSRKKRIFAIVSEI